MVDIVFSFTNTTISASLFHQQKLLPKLQSINAAAVGSILVITKPSECLSWPFRNPSKVRCRIFGIGEEDYKKSATQFHVWSWKHTEILPLLDASLLLSVVLINFFCPVNANSLSR